MPEEEERERRRNIGPGPSLFLDQELKSEDHVSNYDLNFIFVFISFRRYWTPIEIVRLREEEVEVEVKTWISGRSMKGEIEIKRGKPTRGEDHEC